MSAGNRLTPVCLIAPALLAGLAVSLDVGSARADDLQDQVNRRSQVAAQKLEADMRSSLLEAQRLSAKEPEKAEEVLKSSLSQLEDDLDLPEARRESLKRVFKDRIRVLHLTAEKDAAKAQRSAPKETAKEARTATQDKRAAEAEEPLKRAKAIQDSIRDSVDKDRRTRRDNAKRSTDNNIDIARSATPAAGDVEFPESKKWKELTEKRKKDNLTDAERAILKALDTPMAIEFKKSRIEDVIETLQTAMGVTIFADKNILEKVGVTYDTEVTLSFKRPVTARTILRKIFGEIGLTYIVKDETIEVLTPDMAKDLMVVKAYPIGDLVGFSNPFLAPGLGKLQELEFANQIIGMIKQSIEPGGWDDASGAKIVYEPGTRSLVIKQSALVHSMLGKSLR
ncbi:MAG: hypothetical protein ACJ8FY_13315 [Gemmataceae bacterium]